MNRMRDPDRKKTRRPLMSRRRFVKSAGAATTAVAVGFGTSTISAEEQPRLSEDDPTAQALNYVHDAETLDAARRQPGQFCNNCALYAGSADDEWAGCSIFPGKDVAGRGWCNVWAPKQSN